MGIFAAVTVAPGIEPALLPLTVGVVAFPEPIATATGNVFTVATATGNAFAVGMAAVVPAFEPALSPLTLGEPA
jgi:hypothetical protein